MEFTLDEVLHLFFKLMTRERKFELSNVICLNKNLLVILSSL